MSYARRSALCSAVVAIAIVAASSPGCDDAGGEPVAADTATASDSAQADTTHPADTVAPTPKPRPTAPLGGDRPVTTHLPDDYDGVGPYPLVVQLHGFTASGFLQDVFFGFSGLVSDRQFALLLPDGTADPDGARFWNATPACCNFYDGPVDDVAYLTALVAEAVDKLAVDPDRVYLVGHSNGGFMAYRLACEAPELFSGMISLAGSTFATAAECATPAPVDVLQIHGTEDATIPYDGRAGGYPGAPATVARWAERFACADGPSDGPAFDFTTTASGDKTTPSAWRGCAEDKRVELWTIDGGPHLPWLSPGAADRMLDWLFDE